MRLRAWHNLSRELISLPKRFRRTSGLCLSFNFSSVPPPLHLFLLKKIQILDQSSVHISLAPRTNPHLISEERAPQTSTRACALIPNALGEEIRNKYVGNRFDCLLRMVILHWLPCLRKSKVHLGAFLWVVVKVNMNEGKI